VYDVVWGLRKYRSVSYGHYDNTHKTHGTAFENANNIISEKLKINSSDIVLDAGCGAGGSGVQIAKKFGCKVVGINIVPRYIEEAKKYASEEEVSGLADFFVRDYNNTNFTDETFTVIWGGDSFCHADSKPVLLSEMYSVSKKGGGIAVSDIFIKKNSLSKKKERLAQRAANGWAVPFYSQINEFKKELELAGFKKISFEENTKNMMPSISRLFRGFLLFYPRERFLYFLGKKSITELNNIKSVLYHYLCFRMAIFMHGTFYAEK
jgi:ubiquinone/menaquinone biosynthesis C-methylase UbiE